MTSLFATSRLPVEEMVEAFPVELGWPEQNPEPACALEAPASSRKR
jgi:hypothetical protein